MCFVCLTGIFKDYYGNEGKREIFENYVLNFLYVIMFFFFNNLENYLKFNSYLKGFKGFIKPKCLKHEFFLPTNFWVIFFKKPISTKSLYTHIFRYVRHHQNYF